MGYNILASTCNKAGQSERALEAFQAMELCSLAPNVFTYSALAIA